VWNELRIVEAAAMSSPAMNFTSWRRLKNKLLIRSLSSLEDWCTRQPYSVELSEIVDCCLFLKEALKNEGR
jgi:hypothetical protein